MNMKWIVSAVSLLVGLGTVMVSCQASGKKEPNQRLAENVELEPFMGRWYVHGYTPTAIDNDAFGATEIYTLKEGGRIATQYQFRKGGPDGKLKTYNPSGKVLDESSRAEWRMTFFGIIKSAYYIVYVDSGYKYTVVGHPNKKLAWIMSREKTISSVRYERLRGELVSRGYDLEKLQRVAHE